MNTIEDTRDSVAAEVRAAMARRRVTQGSLARAVGISRVSLSERLSGHRAFDTDQLVAIAAALECDLLSFFPASTEAASA